jgi:hypothetical protein
LPANSEIQNIVDEIADLINSTLYKLRFLKWSPWEVRLRPFN